VQIVRLRKVGGNIYIAVSNGSDFTEFASTASGASTPMTGALSIGARSDAFQGFYGKIGGIFTDNTGTPDTAFEQRLRSYYL
jgi:hypothetical protein